MKAKLLKWIVAPLFLALFTGTAWAHNVWMDVSGEQTASQGELITIDLTPTPIGTTPF